MAGYAFRLSSLSYGGRVGCNPPSGLGPFLWTGFLLVTLS